MSNFVWFDINLSLVNAWLEGTWRFLWLDPDTTKWWLSSWFDVEIFRWLWIDSESRVLWLEECDSVTSLLMCTQSSLRINWLRFALFAASHTCMGVCVFAKRNWVWGVLWNIVFKRNWVWGVLWNIVFITYEIFSCHNCLFFNRSTNL